VTYDSSKERSADGGERMPMATPSDDGLPKIWCDSRARGWSGRAGDDCFYVFDEQALDRLGAREGMRLCVFDDEVDGEALGCVGRLERYQDSWRVRPEA
jgi:hypothetical protein